jgi:RNA-directed DNA polymerase
MTNALSKVSSIDFLTEVWKEMFSNTKSRSRDGSGADGESQNAFKENQRANIRNVGVVVRTGSYAFSPLTPHFIEKSTGGHRVICVPTVRDRLVQRAALDFLTAQYMQLGARKSKALLNPVSYGFVRGRSVHEAVNRAVQLRNGAPWVYKTDISKFFDRVARQQLHEAIARHVREKSLHPLLVAASNCEARAATAGEKTKLREAGIKEGTGVRQGMPLSPLFANLLLAEFDAALVATNARAVRYADDLVFFGKTLAECTAYHAFCIEQLAKLDLKVPDLAQAGKSQIYAPDQTADFLGIGMALRAGKYHPKVMPVQFEKMRERFLSLANIEQLAARGVHLATYGAVLDSTASGYLGCYAYCENFPEVEHRIEELREAAIRRLLRDGLKVDLNQLGQHARKFLGL